MNRTRIIGIDPGLVHTGVVHFEFIPEDKRLIVNPLVIPGNDYKEVKNQVLYIWDQPRPCSKRCFIEAYRPRSHFDTDARMTQLVRDIKRAIPGSQVINNTGVKQVITKRLMEALKVWNFTTKTHHQDLRSAAYIGLYGMVKDDELNAVLAEFVRDFIDGAPWQVSHL